MYFCLCLCLTLSLAVSISISFYIICLIRWLLQGQQYMSSDSETLEEVYGLSTIITSRIVPTELNTILYRYEGHLSSMAEALGEEMEATSYHEAATNRKYAINSLMWNASTSR